MEENEFKPLFKELWKQIKVVFGLLSNIGKVLSNRLEHSAKAKVIKNPITTIVVSNTILGLLLLFSNLGWFVKYKTTVKDSDYIEMEVSKRVDQEKLKIEAEADELAFDRYQVKIDSLTQEIISLKGRKNRNMNYKKPVNVNVPSDNKVNEDVKDNKTVSKDDDYGQNSFNKETDGYSY